MNEKANRMVDVVLRPMFFNSYGFWLGVIRLVPSVRALDTFPRWIPYDCKG